MEPVTPKPVRLLSLDALRGFDLFWILGGEHIVQALFKLTAWAWVGVWAEQLTHVKWNGFRAYDLIFPTFLFLAGVSTPFALERRLQAGEKSEVVRKIITRGLILVLLGVIYNNGLQWKGLESMRFGSVLGRIGLAGMFAQLLYVAHYAHPRRLAWWLVGILVGYAAVMLSTSAPGFAPGDLSMEGNFASYFDRQFLLGRLHLKIHDPEGLFSTIPAIATALLGVFVGWWLRRPNEEFSGHAKAGRLALAGLACLVMGGVADSVFPINKNLWTSSFVLWAGGWSVLLMSLFYWIIDVCGIQRWAGFFAVIGMNSVLIYMAGKFINFDYTAKALFGGVARLGAEPVQTMVLTVGFMAVQWGFLWFLQRQRIFLRV
jgi:predicted acyltransferase